jgi:hypothetical protein
MNKDCLKEWIDQAGKDFSNNTRPRLGSGERPSEIKTDNQYDGDESFTMVSLNLLSKHEYLSFAPKDAINSTLVFPQERSMFLEALYIRRSREKHLSPSAASLIQNIDKIFGAELKKIVDRETCVTNLHHGGSFFHLSTSRPPMSPCRDKNRQSFCFGESAIFGGCKIKKLDWMTEAIEQVHSLRLDGSPASNNSGTYTPPSHLKRLPF